MEGGQQTARPHAPAVVPMLGRFGLGGVGAAVAAGRAPPCALPRAAAVLVGLGPVHLTVGEVLRHLSQMAVAALLLLAAQRLCDPPPPIQNQKWLGLGLVRLSKASEPSERNVGQKCVARAFAPYTTQGRLPWLR